MKKYVLAVLDLEEAYTYRLIEYLSIKKSVPFEIQGFTAKESLTEYSNEHAVEVLLISDKIMEESVKQLNISHIVILSENNEIEKGMGDKYIYKYQSSESIVKEVMSYYAEVKEIEQSLTVTKQCTKFFGIYAPVKRTLKTSFALTLGQVMAETKKVLYINLEDYSGFSSIMSNDFHSDMSDLLYFLKLKKENLMYKLGGIIQSIGTLDYIPPAVSPMDIRHIQTDEWLYLLYALAEYSVYEVVILDIGEWIENPFALLQECHKIYTPYKTDYVSLAKMEQYEQLLQFMGYGNIIQNTEKLEFPYFKGIELGVENLVYSQLGSYVRALIENTCIEGAVNE